jgi:hypothetical protein
MDEQLKLLSPLDENVLVPLGEDGLVSARSYTDLEVVSAGFFLFEFARHNRQSKITKRIQTLSPNKELSVITIDVETHESQDSAKSKAPKGLPGPLAQDVYMTLMGLHIESLGKTLPGGTAAVSKDSQTPASSLIPVANQPANNKVYFKIKTLAERLGINPKNSRIADALDHLRRTRIRISGTIFKNDGQEIKVSLDTNYITALSVYRSIKHREDETQWHSAEFSNEIVKNVLNGLIARVDNEKMKQLPSGPTRRLYQMLSSKRHFFRTNQIPVSTEEIRELLCIAQVSFQKYAKKYFSDLLDAKIIDNYTVQRIGGEAYYVFSMVDDDVALLPGLSEASRWYFQRLHDLSVHSPKLKKLLLDGAKCDLTEGKLTGLLREYPQVVQYNRHDYYKTILWADMLIASQIQNGGIQSIFATLRSRLEKDAEPELRGFVYQSFLDQIFENEARKKAHEKALSDKWRAEQTKQVIDQKVQETMQRLERDGKLTRFLQDIRKNLFGQFGDKLPFLNDNAYMKRMAEDVVRHGITSGHPSTDLHEMIQEYKKAGVEFQDTQKAVGPQQVMDL